MGITGVIATNGVTVTVTFDDKVYDTTHDPMVDNGNGLLSVSNNRPATLTETSNDGGSVAGGLGNLVVVFTLDSPAYIGEVCTTNLVASRFTDGTPQSTPALSAFALTNNSTLHPIPLETAQVSADGKKIRLRFGPSAWGSITQEDTNPLHITSALRGSLSCAFDNVVLVNNGKYLDAIYDIPSPPITASDTVTISSNIDIVAGSDTTGPIINTIANIGSTVGAPGSSLTRGSGYYAAQYFGLVTPSF